MDKGHAAGEDRTRLPVVQREREPLTEAEARRIGAAAQQIGKLRHGLNGGSAGALGGSLTVKQGGTATSVIDLDRNTMQAVLALLIEREAVFLSSFGVEVEPAL